ncbi:MAG: ACP phosphodiesterase [Bacteroidota bacterium]
MNFLAHAFLSGENEAILAGNFLGDFIKGREHEKYPEGIQKGVRLHREIDFYSDNHPVFRESRLLLVDKYRHYSGVIVDMFYDHFLAIHFSKYSQVPLKDFTTSVYSSVEKQFPELPGKAKHVFPFMKHDDWLFHYSKVEGLERALQGMSRRTKFDIQMGESVQELKEHFENFENHFFEFFEEIQKHLKS